MLKHKCQEQYHQDSEKFGVRLIRFNGHMGIVKCFSQEKDRIVKLLQSIEQISAKKVHISTIATSGTIHALLQRPILKNLSKTDR